MTKERMFYIAYRICNYMRNLDMQNQFEEHEFCMYVSNLSNEIKYAIENNDSSGLMLYRDALIDELDNVSEEDSIEVKELIDLLDEWKNHLPIYNRK